MTDLTSRPPVEEYDYIVCGGGTSGSVVAARLAEDPKVSVLLIEAGKHSDVLGDTRMAGGWAAMVDTPEDWNIVAEPAPGLNNRQVNLTRGKYLGGCSGCNGTLCIRGVKQDYDDWDLPGWSGEEFWPYMTKAETFHPKEWFPHDAANHGATGPLHTEPFDAAPITRLALDSMVSRGMPYVPDMFTSGDVAQGCGHSVRTVHGGIRSMATDFVTCAGSNLVLLTETTVDKVNLTEDAGGLRASSVDGISQDGKLKTFRARREVIVSGGAYCTPSILLRSGIGEKSEVEGFGIKSQVDLPGVGKNLLDHMIVFSFYEVSRPGITTDHLIYSENGFATAYKLWKETKTGYLANFPLGAIAYARLDDRLEGYALWRDAPHKEGRDPMGLTPRQPNIELLTTESYCGPKQNADFPLGGESTFSIISQLFSPLSKGTVTLKSKDPLQNPVVDHKYLENLLDLLVLSEACRLGNEVVMMGAGTKDIVKGPWPADRTHHAYTTREDWEKYVKQNATTCYHPGGTCKMGNSDDSFAVLDERLRVRGVKGLRVADTSVMPTLNSGHPQMPAYGIGEKCAEMIKQDDKME